MHAAGSAPPALLMLLAACVAEVYVDARFCYVGVSNQRRYNTSTEAVECPPAIYGSNAACAYACARARGVMHVPAQRGFETACAAKPPPPPTRRRNSSRKRVLQPRQHMGAPSFEAKMRADAAVPG